MKINELSLVDEFGLIEKLPYIAVNLTSEQFKEIENRKPRWYEIEGKKIFYVKDKDGNQTGETVAFLVWD